MKFIIILHSKFIKIKIKFIINSLNERKIKSIERFAKRKWIDCSIYLILSIIDELGFLRFCLHSQRYHSRARTNVYKQMTAKLK